MCGKLIVRCLLVAVVSFSMAQNAVTLAQQVRLGPIQQIVDYGGIAGRGFDLRAEDGVAVWYNQIDSEHTKIQAYDFTTQQFFTVRAATSSYFEVSSPDVSGRTIVWSERSSVAGQSSTICNLRSFNLDTQQVTELTNSVGDKYYPAIDNGTVTWTQVQDGNFDVYRAQSPAFTPQAVSANTTAFEGNNDISQGKVFFEYANAETEKYRLLVKDLSSGKIVFDRSSVEPERHHGCGSRGTTRCGETRLQPCTS